MDKTLAKMAALKNRKAVTLSIDKDIYRAAQEKLGGRKISDIVEAFLKDFVDGRVKVDPP